MKNVCGIRTEVIIISITRFRAHFKFVESLAHNQVLQGLKIKYGTFCKLSYVVSE